MTIASLAIGCPVAHREWILDHWFDHVEAACTYASIEPAYVFVGDTIADESFKIIEKRTRCARCLHVRNSRSIDRRDWGLPGRYQEMVMLRNLLLAEVRQLDPDAFLSLDSDILVHPHTIKTLIEDLNDYDAVGARCYMTETGLSYPSWGKLGRDGSLQRIDADGYFPVDVIMAIKMMSRAAYHIDYQLDTQGEDIGWSKACRAARLRLGWDGRVISKHVMAPRLLKIVDRRVGY